MQPVSTERVAHERAHGKKVASTGNPEAVWGWSGPAGERRAERRGNLIAQASRLAPGSRVLEIGCGSGNFSEKFARTGATVIALELSEDLAALARARGLPTDQVTIVTGRFEDYRENQLFDAVVAVSVLHHLEVDTALRRAYELLKQGGSVVFSEPNMLNPQIFLERKLRRFAPRLFGHISPDETAFTRGDIKRRLKAAGFEDVRAYPFDWLHPATPARLIGLIGSIGSVLESIPVIRAFAGSLLISGRKPTVHSGY